MTRDVKPWSQDLRVIVHVLGTAICDCREERGRERTKRGTWREIDELTAASRTAIDTVLDLNRVEDSSDISTVSRTEIEKGNLDARRDPE